MIRSATLACPEPSSLQIYFLPHQSRTSFGHHGQREHALEPSPSIGPGPGHDRGSHRLPPGGLQHTFLPHVHQHGVVGLQQRPRHHRDAEEPVSPPAHKHFHPQPGCVRPHDRPVRLPGRHHHQLSGVFLYRTHRLRLPGICCELFR